MSRYLPFHPDLTWLGDDIDISFGMVRTQEAGQVLDASLVTGCVIVLRHVTRSLQALLIKDL